MVKKKTTSYTAMKVIALILAALTAAYCGISIWKETWDCTKWFSEARPQPEDPGGETETPDQHLSGIKLASAIIPEAEYELYGISAEVERAARLTVKAVPEGAELTDGKFTCEFVPSSEGIGEEWQNGKVISEYVALKQTDGGNATLECYKPFGAGVKITYTVTGENNEVLTATTTIQYVRKIKSMKCILLHGYLSDKDKISFTHACQTGSRAISVECEFTDVYSKNNTYTLNETESFVRLTPAFVNKCAEKGIELPDAAGKIKFTAINEGLYRLENGLIDGFFGGESGSVYRTEAFRNAVLETGEKGVFELRLFLSNDFLENDKVFIITLGLDTDTFPIAAQDVGVDSDGRYDGNL